MQGHQVKRGVTSTLERVFHASGQRIEKLQVFWTGKTAGINFSRNTKGEVDAKVVFPAINEIDEIPRAKFNNLIGFAIHELGHAWFTDNEPWDNARERNGAYLNALINGLEDPRIEKQVIDSGYAENSRVLFEELLNAMLDEHGYVEPDDIDNVSFMLAVEGRRLNGYAVNVPTVLDRCPWSADLQWAMGEASKATNTKRVVEVATELMKRLKKATKEQYQNPPPQPKAGKGKQAGSGQGQQGEGQQAGDAEGEGEAESNAKGNKPKRGGGHSTSPFDESNFKARRVEPDAFIQNQLADHADLSSERNPIPAYRKPRIHKLNFS